MPQPTNSRSAIPPGSRARVPAESRPSGRGLTEETPVEGRASRTSVRPASTPPKGSRPASTPPKGSSRPESSPPKGSSRPESAPPKGSGRSDSAAPKAERATSESPRARGRPRGPFTQHRRLDTLRALLQRHPKGLTIYELARELNVTPRSLRRYLGEVKREIDLISSVDKPGGARLWRLAPSEVPRKVEVRRTQAYALLAARRLFEPMRGSTLYEEIDLAAQKLFAVARRPGRGPNAGVADARLEERFLYLPFAPKDYAAHTEELDDLFQAVADLRPLRCLYRRAKDGQEERVTIHPYAMVLYKDAIYCVGLHVGKKEIRTFLLDRMRDTECAVTERFELPEDFSIDDHFQGQFGIWRGSEPKRVVIDFDAKVAEFVRTRRVHPSQELAPLQKGGVRMTMMIGDLTELATWILGFGETARVVEPPELVERVIRELEGALAHYGKKK
jgi:predicted DNA-binding transcriptional regulator YafY